MNKSKLFCCGWWPFVVLPLVSLLFALILFWRNIEADVANNAEQSLTEKNLPWATVDTHSNGRNVVLTGVAPDENQRDLAITTVEDTWGVRKVIWQGEVAAASAPKLKPEPEPEISPAPPSPEAISPAPSVDLQAPEIAIVKADGALLISGSSATALAEELELPLDSSNYETNSVFAELPELNDLMLFAQGLPDGSALMISGNKMVLTGRVAALGVKKQIALQAGEIYSGEIDNQINVQLAAVAEDQLVSKEQCQQLFDDLSRSETVNFATAKADILPASYGLLDRFTQLSLRCPDANFIVSGHTDNTGNPDFNTKISLARAQAVVDHIVNSGVSSDRFSAEGKGPSHPIADNNTEVGRAKNRRVEFKIID